MAHGRERLRCLQELGLTESASEDDIKKAYRAAAFKYHPDKNPGKDTTSKFQQISAAYKILIEGDAVLKHMREDAAEFSILRFLFPWLFENVFPQRQNNPFYGYYDDMSDEEDDYAQYVPPHTRTTYTTATPSGASQYYHRNATFTHTSAQHGQFFQDKQTKGKAAKKRNRDAKRATKSAADKERSESAKMPASDTRSHYTTERSKSPTPDLLRNQQTSQKSESQEKNNASNNTETRKDNSEDQTNKKSKKQVHMEEKQREKELKEINEELLRQEKEKKEKMEKKRAAQEEKEKQEREAREKEKQQREEEERRQAEELRKLMEKKDEEKKQKKREAAKMKKLFDEFDNSTFLDENGDFKYTDPEMKNVICRDDINYLGNASKNKPHEKLEMINGLNTESLIKLQEGTKVEGNSKPPEEKVLGSPDHARLGPIGSRPQRGYTTRREHSGQRYNYNNNYNTDYQPRFQQQHHYQQQQPPRQQPPQQPQQFYNHPPRQHAPKMPYWSPNQPPPPLHSINTNVPRASGRFNPGYSDNKGFQNQGAFTRTFTSRGFQGNI